MTGGRIEDNQTGSELIRYGANKRPAAGGVVVLGSDAGFIFKCGIIRNNVSSANQIGIYAEEGTFSMSARAELGMENQLILAESCKVTIAKEQLDKIFTSIEK